MSRNPIRDSGIDLAADADFRSRYLQKSIRQAIEESLAHVERPIPLILIQYWDDTDIPADVKRCLDSWLVTERLGFERQVFDRGRARRFIESNFNETQVRAFDSCRHPAMRSDYFRLCYLLVNGGLYVDADDELRQPDAILPLVNAGLLQLQTLCYRRSTDSMVVPVEFADEVGNDLIFYVANDPMLAPPRHPVVASALAQATGRLIAASGNSRDVQWLTGPGNLSEALVRHSLQLESSNAPSDFKFISSWVQIAPGDWTLDYRNDDRNWRLWITGDDPQ